MNLDKLIITRPENQTKTQKATGFLLTAVAWTVWSYLWLPLLGLFGWYLGFEFLQHSLEDSGWKAFLAALPIYLEYIALSSGTLIVWALLNWARFKGARDKRAQGEHKIISAQDLANRIQVPTHNILTWQKTQRLVAHYFKSGKISHMVTDGSAPFLGFSAIDDEDFSARYANDLEEITLKESNTRERTNMLDIDISKSQEEELILVDKKIEKLKSKKSFYERDLEKLSEHAEPQKIVPLFAAQKRRLAAISSALDAYENKKIMLNLSQSTQIQQIKGHKKINGTLIVDGTANALAKELEDAVL